MVMQDIVQGTSKLRILLDPIKRKSIRDAEKSINRTRSLGAELITERTSSGKFKTYDDVLDHVIEANINEASGSVDMEDCLDDFLTMYFAGNATTVSTLSWSVAELIRNPAVMNRLRDEVDDVWCAAEIDGSSDPHQYWECPTGDEVFGSLCERSSSLPPSCLLQRKEMCLPRKIGRVFNTA